MNTSARVIAAILLFAGVAAATDYQQYEVYLGYSFVRFNPNTSYVPSANFNGGTGQFVYNFSRWLGVAVDAGAVTKGGIGGYDIDSTVANFTAGPRFSWNRHSRFKPFVQALFGGAYATSSAQIPSLVVVPPGVNGPVYPPGLVVPPNSSLSARLVTSRTGFAMLLGGGIDVKVGKHIYIRPVEADYYFTRMPSYLPIGDIDRNNFRYSAGVNFMFGTPR
jgi:Outer membrane protein beta-barrel domain